MNLQWTWMSSTEGLLRMSLTSADSARTSPASSGVWEQCSPITHSSTEEAAAADRASVSRQAEAWNRLRVELAHVGRSAGASLPGPRCPFTAPVKNDFLLGGTHLCCLLVVWLRLPLKHVLVLFFLPKNRWGCFLKTAMESQRFPPISILGSCLLNDGIKSP